MAVQLLNVQATASLMSTEATSRTRLEGVILTSTSATLGMKMLTKVVAWALQGVHDILILMILE